MMYVRAGDVREVRQIWGMVLRMLEGALRAHWDER